jgi:hypothetical protein
MGQSMRYSVRHSVRLSPLVALAAVVGGITCTFPTDKSNEVNVLIEAPHTFLLRGEEMSVRARAFRVVGGADTVEVPNVDFTWISGSNSTARVDKECCGYATVTGVNRGAVGIYAHAVAFENSADGLLSLRVANPLEIDSVRPRRVHYGEVVTVYGIGVDSIRLSQLNQTNLIEYPFSRTQRNDTSGVAQLAYWVPPPAQTGNLLALGAGGVGIADSVTTIIDSADVYEPNDTQPSLVNLDVPGPIPQLPELLFINPALSFEPQPPRAFIAGADWYRFSRSDTAQPLTLVFKPGALLLRTGGFAAFFTDSISHAGPDLYFAPGSWLRGTGFQYCRGVQVDYFEEISDSVVLALKTLPGKSIHLFTRFFASDRYEISVEAGYRTADPRIGPDRFEENDVCTYADDNFARIPIVLTSGGPDFVDGTLTVDNPHDFDWYKFRVQGALPETVSIASASRPFPGDTDRSDIDLYVFRPSDGSLLAFSLGVTAAELLSVLLDPGDYLLAVVDYIGQPTRYGLCMTTAPSGCSPPGATGARAAPARRDPRKMSLPLAPGDRRMEFLRKWRPPSPKP